MKLLTLSELKENAKEHFNRLQVNKLFATTDGQFFLMENRAQLHAGTGNVHRIDNEEPAENPESKTPEMTVKELTAKVALMEDINEVQHLLLAEIAGPNRATAVKAIEERITKLAA